MVSIVRNTLKDERKRMWNESIVAYTTSFFQQFLSGNPVNSSMGQNLFQKCFVFGRRAMSSTQPPLTDLTLYRIFIHDLRYV
jgi:hypothetical protein